MGKLRSLKVGATYDDLCAVPENLVAEMFDGELYATPRPPLPHAHAASVLGELGGPFHRGRHGPGGWWIRRAGATFRRGRAGSKSRRLAPPETRIVTDDTVFHACT
jgi:hypothetical protein